MYLNFQRRILPFFLFNFFLLAILGGVVCLFCLRRSALVWVFFLFVWLLGFGFFVLEMFILILAKQLSMVVTGEDQ